MDKKNCLAENTIKNIRRRLIVSVVLLIIAFCQFGVVFAWFIESNAVQSSATFTIVKPDAWGFSDSAYYKFESEPFSVVSGQFYLDSYDYVITENNDKNNVFVVFEVELLSDTTDFSFNVQTREHPLLTKQYNTCNMAGAMTSVRGTPEYSINQIGYSVYYFNTTSQSYALCEDYEQITYANGAYLYGLVPCYYSTFYLSDCLTVDFCVPDIADIEELQDKTVVGGLKGLNELYVSLTAYFDSNIFESDSFVNTTNWVKKTTMTFAGNFTNDKIKTINGRRFAYLILNLKYSAAVMTNTNPNYTFERNINQLFVSDFSFELN